MNKTCKHDYVPLEINEVHQNVKTSSAPSYQPQLHQSQPAQPAQPTQTAQPTQQAHGYVPKQGKMTVEDVEEEIAMLMERMEFLEKTLQDLKKENEKNL